MTRAILTVVALFLMLSTTLASAEEKKLVYDQYVNARFGYVVSYPAALLIPQGEADNADGQRFLSKERDIEMAVWGEYNTLEDTLQSKFRDHSRSHTEDEPDLEVTYKHLSHNWFVVSGYIGNNIFYEKTILRDDIFLTFYITYPQSNKVMWNPIVATISKSFSQISNQ